MPAYDCNPGPQSGGSVDPQGPGRPDWHLPLRKLRIRAPRIADFFWLDQKNPQSADLRRDDP
jgi:hypothetical protein